MQSPGFFYHSCATLLQHTNYKQWSRHTHAEFDCTETEKSTSIIIIHIQWNKRQLAALHFCNWRRGKGHLRNINKNVTASKRYEPKTIYNSLPQNMAEGKKKTTKNNGPEKREEAAEETNWRAKRQLQTTRINREKWSKEAAYVRGTTAFIFLFVLKRCKL